MSMTAVDFEYLRNLMREQTAIVLDSGKEYIAECRLAQLMANEGFQSLSELVRNLRTNRDAELHRKVVNAMTNNETWFFRDLLPFEAVRKTVIPSLLVSRGNSRRIRIWSAACSSGQEPYSLAMLIHDNFPELRAWDSRIIATDISTAILDRARKGRFSQLEVNRGLPAAMLARYFHRDGLQWVISPELQKMIDFSPLNLAERWRDLPMMDVIFLRNVLIYFDIQTKKTILSRARQLLRPDGYLFLGGAETTLNLEDGFERVQFENTAYYRPR